MVRYRRNFVAGGTYFFTVALGDRHSSALIDHVDALRGAFHSTRRTYLFTIDAVVVLPDHLHIVMTLPDKDADYPNRWRLIKRRFTAAVAEADVPILRHRNGERALWQRRYWEHTIRDERDLSAMSTTSISTPSSMGLSRASATGRIRLFIAMCGADCCPKIGAATSLAIRPALASRQGDPGFRGTRNPGYGPGLSAQRRECPTM